MKQLLRIVLLLGLLGCIWSVIPRAQSTGTVSNPPVGCPLCDTCYTKSSADMKVFSTALTEGKTYTVNPDSNGKIKLTFNWPSNGQYTGSGECCSSSNIPTISGKITANSGSKNDTFSLGVEKILTVSEWKFPIKLEVYSKRQGSSEESRCLTYTLELSDCETCPDSSCSVSGSVSSAKFSIPIGTGGGFGEVRASLFADIETLPHPGRSALKLMAPTEFTPTLDGNGHIASVSSNSVSAVVTNSGTTYDPNAYTITLSHLGGAAFRTVKVEAIDTSNAPIKKLRLTDTRTGEAAKVMEWTQTVVSPTVTTWVFTEAGGLRKTTVTKTAVDATHRTERITISEKNAANADIVVSVRLLNYVMVGGNWEVEREEIDPDNAPLVTTWTYYGAGERTGPGASTEGVGYLKQMVRYDGYSEVHTYWRDGSNHRQHAVVKPFANGGTMTTTSGWNSLTSTETETTVVGSNLLEQTITTFGINTRTTDIYTNQASYLRTVTTSTASGKPSTIIHPDGTRTIYAYVPDGPNLTTTVKTGAFSGADVTDGTKTVTTTNTKGEVTESISSIFINSGASETVTDHWKITSADAFGRPLSTQYFPVGGSAAWTITKTYDCCGIASETDRYGVATSYVHDDLKRQTSMTRLNVTTATIYDGLTTRTKRGPLGGTLAEIENSTRNLKGTLVTSSGPSPQTGGLVQLSSTAISYGLPGNIGQRTVTTAIQVTDDGAITPSQTEDRYADGRVYQSSGDLSPTIRFSYTAETAGLATTRSYVDVANLRESTTTHTDCAGHTTSIDQLNEAGATVTTTYAYDTAAGAVSGRLLSVTDPDGVKTLFGYNSRGERHQTALRLTSTATGIDLASDQITETNTEPGTYTPSGGSSISVIKTETKVYPTGSSPVTTSTTYRTPDGLKSWTVDLGVLNATSSVTTLSGNGAWTETTTRPDGTRRVASYSGGLPSTVDELKTVAAGNTPISQITYTTYDVFKRPTHVTDSRTGTTVTAYRSNISDVVASVTDPATRVTAYAYDHRGRRTSVNHPDTTLEGGAGSANVVTTSHFPDGSVKEVSGDQTYRTAYAYDFAGRQRTMTTYGTTTATTTWNYNQNSGRLTSKTDHASHGASYSYSNGGRLKSRTWARGKHTTYDYASGRLIATRHFTASGIGAPSDPDTGDIGTTYNRLGQPLRMVTASTSSQPGTSVVYAYDGTSLRLTDETVSVDPDITFSVGASAITVTEGAVPVSLQRVVERKADTLLRDTGTDLRVTSGGSLDVGSTLAYHASEGRLETVTANLNGTNRTFTYGYRANSYGLIETVTGLAHTVTNTWDPSRDLLQMKENTVGGSNISTYDYGANGLGQRESANVSGSAFATEADWTWNYNLRGELVSAHHANTAAARRFFVFDGIGNRTEHREGTSTSTGGTALSYTPDSVNQYSAIGNLNPTSGTQPLYDLDGNLTRGPLPNAPAANATLTWDGENRLLTVAPVGAASATRYLYDARSRRVAKTTGTGSGARTYFFYDGWNLLAEYTGDIHTTGTAPLVTLQRSYAWGTDLSGTAQGAGGVGGLLAAQIHTPPNAGVYYPTYDGNGNVSEYLNSTGGVAAHYEYGPFGERLIPPTGVGLELPFRFSTKYQDAETGLYSYIFRPYDPLTGRWLSRDPIEEEGGTNLYGFISNASISTVDILGLVEWVVGKDWIAAAEGEKDNATATEAAGVTFRNVFLTQNAEVSVTKHPSCECYIASLSKPFKAKAVVATTTPNVGIWRNGLLDAASVKAVQLHEAWHVGIFVTYVKTVWEPLEQWSQNYRKYFKTESEAREAIQWDMRYALAELNRWQGRWKDGQDRAFGHVNLYRTPLRPQETFDHGKQRIISRWSAPDNGNWGAKANALVQNWDVNYTRSERKGNCP